MFIKEFNEQKQRRQRRRLRRPAHWACVLCICLLISYIMNIYGDSLCMPYIFHIYMFKICSIDFPLYVSEWFLSPEAQRTLKRQPGEPWRATVTHSL